MPATMTVSKWGNSSGVRIPEHIMRTLNIKAGDKFIYTVVNGNILLTPLKEERKTTKQLFEKYYGKPYEKITAADLGNESELDWGEDVGSEELS